MTREIKLLDVVQKIKAVVNGRKKHANVLSVNSVSFRLAMKNWSVASVISSRKQMHGSLAVKLPALMYPSTKLDLICNLLIRSSSKL